MKHLYIRYFRNKEDTMPANSDRVSNKESVIIADLEEFGVAESIFWWTNNYPNGKVDFVWL